MNIYSKSLAVKFFIICIVSIFSFQPIHAQTNNQIEYYQATVLNQQTIDKIDNLNINQKFNDWQTIIFKFDNGPLIDQENTFENQASIINKNDRFLDKNDHIIVSYQLVNGEGKISLAEYNRQWPLITLLILCLIIIIVVGRWIGLKAILSFVWIGAILTIVLLKNILTGHNTYLMTAITAILIIIGTSTILLGINKKTITVIISSFSGIIISAFLMFVIGQWSHFSAIGHEETNLFQLSPPLSKLDLASLIYCSIIIGAIGSMIDMSISIVSGLDEIITTAQQKDIRKISQKEIFSSGLNMGRNMMAAETNTMTLAYFGSALLLWIVALSQNYHWSVLLNFPIIFDEILRILAGAIGIFSVIPLTSYIASKLLTYQRHFHQQKTIQ